MSFKLHYQSLISQPGFRHDFEQMQAVDELQRIADDLVSRHRKKRLLNSLRRGFTARSNKGCYIWGGVGRGKTWLMDMFFNKLPLTNKKRWHFHQFMYKVHNQLNTVKNNRDPLRIIAKRFAHKYRVICLDEFHVSDITDAMLLHGLLQELFKKGVVLVFTSNHHPENLYKNGLQRERFVPAIDLIMQHTVVIKLKGELDHRRTGSINGSNYYYLQPQHEQTTDNAQEMLDQFRALAANNEKIHKHTDIKINNRKIAVKYLAANQVWFEFDQLCGEGRATVDYIEIAKQFNTIFISKIPCLDASLDDMAKRFIHLIDELYDHKITLVLSAATHAQYLYKGRRFQSEFLRTVSRLTEMRSDKYIKSSPI